MSVSSRDEAAGAEPTASGSRVSGGDAVRLGIPAVSEPAASSLLLPGIIEPYGTAPVPLPPGQACKDFLSWAWFWTREPYAHCAICGLHLDRHEMTDERRAHLRAAIDEEQRLDPRPL